MGKIHFSLAAIHLYSAVEDVTAAMRRSKTKQYRPVHVPFLLYQPKPFPVSFSFPPTSPATCRPLPPIWICKTTNSNILHNWQDNQPLRAILGGNSPLPEFGFEVIRVTLSPKIRLAEGNLANSKAQYCLPYFSRLCISL